MVVVPLAGGTHLERCLEALRRQVGAPPMEVIVPHDERLRGMGFLFQNSPPIRVVPLPGRLSCAELRAAGVCASRGRIVAITEDQCIPPPRWCANVVQAHSNSCVAIGGPLEKHQPDTPLGWALYLREFVHYIPPVKEGRSACLTDSNVSYKRGALEAIRGVWAGAFHEPQVHAALRKRGETLWLSPALLSYQQRSMELRPALRERYEFGRLYGSLRATAVPTGRRLLLIASSAFLPVLLLARVVFAVGRKRRHVGACLAAFPYLVLFATAWSWGEFIGYLTARGPGPK